MSALATYFRPVKRPKPGQPETVLRSECQKCALNLAAKNPFLGPIRPEKVPEKGWILIVNESPDILSDNAKTLEEGKDYRWLRKLFSNLGIADRVWYHTAVRCCPTSLATKDIKLRDLPTRSHIGQCSKLLEEDIAFIKPVAIITIGGNATLSVLGRKDILSIAGQRFLREDGIPVFPVWGVGYAFRDPTRLLSPYGALWEKVVGQIDSHKDTLEVSDIVGVEGWTLPIVKAWFEPVLNKLETLKTFAQKLKYPLAWDTETRRNRPYGPDFAVAMFSFYHPEQDQPLIVPVDHVEAEGRYTAYIDKHEITNASSLWEVEKQRILAWLKAEILEKEKVKKVGQNVKYDENATFGAFKISPRGFIADTMLMAYCYNPTRQGHYGLDDLAREMLTVPEYWKDIDAWRVPHKDTPIEFDYTMVPWDILVPYAAWDAVVTYMLYRKLRSKLLAHGKNNYGGWFVRVGTKPPKKSTYSVYDYAMNCRKIHHLLTAQMEQAGQAIDRDVVDQVAIYYRQIRDAEAKLLNADPDVISWNKKGQAEGRKPDKGQTLYTINWASPDQLREFFCDHLSLPTIHKTTKGEDSTDAYALKVWSTKHKCGVAKKLIAYREAAKFLSTYIDPLFSDDPEKRLVGVDDYIHSDFKCASTASSRLSASRPNSQNMPRRGLVKRLYYSRFKNGWILQRDYSGLEVRILALMSRDENLLRIFRTGGDPHFYTQQHFFSDKADKKNKDQRSICKQALFGKVYGQGDKGLFDLLSEAGVISPKTGKPITLEECAEFNQMLESAYPGVARYIDYCHSAAIKNKWCSSAFGFVRPLPEMEFYDRHQFLRETGDWTSEESREMSMQIGDAKRQSQNTPIQSTAGDLTVFAAYMIGNALAKRRRSMGCRALLVNCVHDSIYVDLPAEEVEEVDALMASLMDNSKDWLPDLLPGYDASWMDIPIIGEFEMGLDAKDCVSAIEETSLTDPSKELKFKIPMDDSGKKLIETSGDCLRWKNDEGAIRAYLTDLRKQNIWHK